MAISSTGIGSGLDVTSIISQLSALEKQPLKALQSKATNLQAELSTIGQIQSQVSALATAAAKVGSVLTWKGMTSSSSNSSAVGVSSSSGATASSFSVEVSQLAKPQIVALPTGVGAPALPAVDAQFGSGTVTIQVGSKSTTVTIAQGQGSLSTIAQKINEASAGVTATVLRDGSGKENIIFRSTDTGSAGSFSITTVDSDGLADNSGLSRLNYPYVAPAPGVPTVASLNPTAIDPQATLPQAGAAIGTGVLHISVGGAAATDVVIGLNGLGQPPSLSEIAAQISASPAGVTATVVSAGNGEENLQITPNSPNQYASLNVTVSDDDLNDADLSGLSLLNMAATGTPPLANPSPGMALTQAAQDAMGTVNGVAVTSSKNTLTDVVPGITLTLSQVTTSPVEVTIGKDTASISKALQGFVDAYNALNSSLADVTKYDAGTKTAGIFQGDSVATGLSNALHRLMGSLTQTGSTFSRLADVGITAQLGGNLSIDSSKMSSAMEDVDNLQKLFTAYNGSDSTNGFGLRVKDFANGLLAATGTVSNKTDAIKRAITKNFSDQDRVNARAAAMEERLKKQYSALDAKMASLTALNAYVAQQVTAWNKSGN